jgi:hypothetical protein
MNVFSGLIIAFLISQLAHEYQAVIRKYIWAGFTWEISAGSNMMVTAVLTAVSVGRGYFWRRHFNRRSNN